MLWEKIFAMSATSFLRYDNQEEGLKTDVHNTTSISIQYRQLSISPFYHSTTHFEHSFVSLVHLWAMTKPTQLNSGSTAALAGEATFIHTNSYFNCGQAEILAVLSDAECKYCSWQFRDELLVTDDSLQYARMSWFQITWHFANSITSWKNTCNDRHILYSNKVKVLINWKKFTLFQVKSIHTLKHFTTLKSSQNLHKYCNVLLLLCY